MNEPLTLDEGTAFSEHPALIWVCDVSGSSKALNDASSGEAMRTFLTRFFWLSKQLPTTTDASFQKWTGDGFVMVWWLSDEGSLGSRAQRAIRVAWEMSAVTSALADGLSLADVGVRHGIAYEPNAIIVEHQEPTPLSVPHMSKDVIGRGAVLAFRLSGLLAPFPSIVCDDPCFTSAREAGMTDAFDRLQLSESQIEKYFKGERYGTDVLWSSRGSQSLITVDPREYALRSTSALLFSPEDDWLKRFYSRLMAGPHWARDLRARISMDQKQRMLAMAHGYHFEVEPEYQAVARHAMSDVARGMMDESTLLNALSSRGLL